MVKSWLYFKEQEHEQQLRVKVRKFRARYAVVDLFQNLFLKHH